MRLVTRLVTALVVTSSLVPMSPSEAAASKKGFHESLLINGVMSTGPLTAATSYDLRFTLTNDTLSPQAFGSAQILVPSGYVVGTTMADVGNFLATPLTGSILVTSTGPTGAGIQPGSSLIISATVTTPTAGSCKGSWATRVKQSNDFSGTGNDFQPLDLPAPTTTTGTSHLSFSAQPHLTEWDVAMTPAVEVTALDACGSTDSSFVGPVTLSDGGRIATGALETATAGRATFAGLTFNDFGITDVLTASATGYPSVDSASFDVVQKLVACAAGTSCPTVKIGDTAGTTLVSITAASGPSADVLSATVKGDPKTAFGSCGQPTGSSEPALGAIVTFNVTTRAKAVTMTLPRFYVNQIPNNGTPFMDVCLDVPTAFVDKFGHTVTTGLLPNCTTVRTTVCVSDRRKNAGDEILTMLLPPGDPRGSWF